MKHFYFIRHGESEDNKAGIWNHDDVKLTKEGEDGAHEAARKIKEEGLQFDLMLASPLTRTRQTAEIIATDIGYPLDKIAYDDSFKERSFGKLEGTPQKDVLPDWEHYSVLDTIDTVEKLEDMQKRSAEVLEYIKSLPQDNILLVGHAVMGRCFRRLVAGQPYTVEYSEPFNQIPNATVIKFI